MKVAIMAPVWGRPEIFTLFCEGIKQLKGNIICVIAGSPGDRCKGIADKYGFDYITVPNQPLCQKVNAGALRCKVHNPDQVLMLGSDDIINQSLFDNYVNSAADYQYLLDCYFYDTTTSLGLFWAGYNKTHNKGDACGAGRVLSAKLMDQLKWQPWGLGYDAVLDTGMDVALRRCNYTKRVMRLANTTDFLLDVKSSTNMTPFEQWDNSEYIYDIKAKMRTALGRELAKQIISCKKSTSQAAPKAAQRS